MSLDDWAFAVLCANRCTIGRSTTADDSRIGTVTDSIHNRLDITFLTQQLRTACERRKSAEKLCGAEGAEVLFATLSDIRAAPDCAALLELMGQDPVPPDNEIVLELSDHRALVIAAAHARLPVKPSGAVDWKDVTRVQVIELRVLQNVL